jgi:acylphosphatase
MPGAGGGWNRLVAARRARGLIYAAPRCTEFRSLWAMVRQRVVVHGRVQGVGFRYALSRAAATRGVAGWARNRPDGTLEAVFEGDAEAVDSLVRFCRDGPRGAAVERVEIFDEEPEGLARFDAA